jgi:hypothetical protein
MPTGGSGSPTCPPTDALAPHSAMHIHEIFARDQVDTQTVRRASRILLERLGPMLACAWPDMPTWLDEIVPELAAEQPDPPFAPFQLNPREKQRLLAPQLDTLYPVSDEILLTRLLLAAIRHCELSIVLLPQHVWRGHVVGLLRLADESRFQAPEPHRPLRAIWLLDVGIHDADEKIIRVFADRHEDLEDVTALLAPLGAAGAPQQENRLP